MRELTERALLQQVTPAAVLVNGQGEILYLHGRTGMYLEPAPGEAGVNNILKMAREGLRNELTTALHKAAATREIVLHPGVRVKTNGDLTTVNLTIRPLAAGPVGAMDTHLYLVTLEEAAEAARTETPARWDPSDVTADANIDERIAALKQELRSKEEYLQAANEELETSNEELKSSNEEMQSVNEELQSTNEELETSKEELQSVNEELATVNAELQTKVADLSRVNNDMNNLLAGTGIATVFVDHQLRIMRFTPTATRIINLILSDVGRPVGHIVSNLVGYSGLVSDVRAVLDSLMPKQLEVQTTEGKWYMMRILPYRTLENVIEGAVLTFTEITELKNSRQAVREFEAARRLAAVVRDASDAMMVLDFEGRILAWNPGAETLYGWSEAEALTMNIRNLIPEDHREQALAAVWRLGRAAVLEPCRVQRITKHGRTLDVWLTATALVNSAADTYAIATTERPFVD